MELVLYSTDHCTLCDQALELLFSMPELAGQAVRVVDVATDDALLSRYGERLPVLELTAAAEDSTVRILDWPFDAGSVLGALHAVMGD
jgi:hypothetical protein